MRYAVPNQYLSHYVSSNKYIVGMLTTLQYKNTSYITCTYAYKLTAFIILYLHPQ